MLQTSKELGRGRREKGRRRACAPRPSVFLPCLISFLPLLVSRLRALFSAWLCVALWPSVLFLWVRFCPDCGPLGRKGPVCKCELDRESGTERHIVLGVLGELGVQSDPVSCHHRTKLSAHTHHFCLNLFSVFLLQRSAKDFKVMQMNRSASSRSWKVFELRKLH